MTLDEALAELGIDGSAGTDGARRAYLRLLKTRKPETDPSGFMRLREAYEIVKSDLAFWEPLAGAVAATAPRPAVPQPTVEPAPPPAPPPEPAIAVESSAEDAGGAPVEDRPITPAKAHDVAPLEPSVASAEGGGAPQGRSADEPEDIAVLEAVVEAALRQGKHVEAALGMTLLFHAAAARQSSPPPPTSKALRLMLALHAENALAEASALQDRFVAWLEASGQETRVLRGEAAARWTVVRELAALPSSLPAAVRTAIAEAATQGDLANARAALTSFRAQRRSAALSAGLLLRRKAPTIAAALADALDPPAPQVMPGPLPGPQQRSRSAWWIVFVAVAGLLRVIFAAGRSPSPTYSPSFTMPPSNLSFAKPYPPLLLDGGFMLPTRIDQLRSTALSRAQRVESDAAFTHPEVSKAATSIVEALEAKDCDAAGKTAKSLSTQMKGTKQTGVAQAIGAEITLLEISVRSYCAELASSGDASGSAATADAGRAGDAGRDAGERTPKALPRKGARADAEVPDAGARRGAEEPK